MIDIKTTARRVLLYTVLIVGTGVIFGFFNFFQTRLEEKFGKVAYFTVPLIVSIFAVIFGRIVWEAVRRSDILKYEFINIITHKFRTPLTRIKWSSEFLLEEKLSVSGERSLRDIQSADAELIKLTLELVALANQKEGKTQRALFKADDFRAFLEGIVQKYQSKFEEKQITLSPSLPPGILPMLMDKNSMEFVFSVLLDNALSYTRLQGNVSLSLVAEKRKIVVEVKDTGIGISGEELPLIFKKFYRTATAKREDTEGLGIGLSLSREIIKRHWGTMTVNSAGKDKGTVFTITLPLMR